MEILPRAITDAIYLIKLESEYHTLTFNHMCYNYYYEKFKAVQP